MNASATTSGVAGTSVASAAAPGPSPESLLVLHSVQAGLGREAILERIRTLVPTRTVVRVRQATSLEASAAGLAQTSGALVAEFRSELYARWDTCYTVCFGGTIKRAEGVRATPALYVDCLYRPKLGVDLLCFVCWYIMAYILCCQWDSEIFLL